MIEARHRERITAARNANATRAGRISAAKRTGNATEVSKLEAVPTLSVGGTADVASRAVGMSVPSYERARAVVTDAERDPERFGDLPERMDAVG